MTCVAGYAPLLPQLARSLGCTRFRVVCARVGGEVVCLACCDPNGLTLDELYRRLVS